MIGSRARRGRFLVPLSVFVCISLVGCGQGDDDEYPSADAPAPQNASITVPDLSDVAHQGAELFTTSCSECHGPNAGGSSQGPSLIDRVYEPNHHADLSFHRAVSFGSPQHHWQFGDMDPVPGLSTEEVDKIICYVRELQYANGIFSDPAGLTACQG